MKKLNSQPLHSIQVAARRSGLKPDAIRAWERRHQAVVPVRTPTGRRLYGDEDIDRLTTLARLTADGHRIGDIAHLPTETLRTMVQREAAPALATGSGGNVLAECLEAMRDLNGPRLRSILDHAVISLAPDVFIDAVAVPLLREVGLMWWTGRANPGHEHLVTSIVRSALMDIVTRQPGQRSRGVMVVATPVGQRHEVGALLVATTAAIESWTVHYLGADLPADAIGSALKQTDADMLALSMIHPPDDPALPAELMRIKREAPPGITILAGGSAASSYGEALEAMGAEVLPDLAGLRLVLRADQAEERLEVNERLG